MASPRGPRLPPLLGPGRTDALVYAPRSPAEPDLGRPGATSSVGALSDDVRLRSPVRHLQDELTRAAHAAAAVQGLRHPPWLESEAAKTLFKDVDLLQMRRDADLAWRKPSSLPAAVEAEVAPIMATRTATGMIILHEGRTATAEAEALRRRFEELQAKGLLAASGADAGSGGGKGAFSVSAAARRADAGASAGELTVLHDDLVHGRNKSARGKALVRFKYKFVPPPWEFAARERGKRKPPRDKAAARAAGVRDTSALRMPVAPSHLRYIEALEDSVAELATECGGRRRMLLARLERFMEPGWRPPGIQDALQPRSLGAGADLASGVARALRGGGGGGDDDDDDGGEDDDYAGDSDDGGGHGGRDDDDLADVDIHAITGNPGRSRSPSHLPH